MVRRQRKVKIEEEEEDVVVMDVDGSDGDGDHAMPDEEIVQVKGEGSADDDDDDEIVREIPVFLSPALAHEIQLIQYPLQPNQIHPHGPEAVRVKPRHCMMEIDLPTPTNIQFQGLYHMPSRTFSSQTIPVSTHMALGKMIEVETTQAGKTMGLHLVPLSRMTQMRPSFSHIDEAHEASTATTESDLQKQRETSALGGSERKSITFRKKESERQELARKSSYGYKKASEDAEGWHSLEVYDEASLQARLVMDQVQCPVEHQANNLLDVTSLEKEDGSQKKIPGTSLNAAYLNTLNYLPPREDFAADTATTLGTPKGGSDGDDDDDDDESNLANIVVKLVKLMRLGKPIPFSLLRAEFPQPSGKKGSGISDTTLCVALGSCATLVRGNWCLNSKLLSYPQAMTQARTFLLCLFQSMRVVHRERLLNVFAQDPASQTGPQDDNEKDLEDVVTPEVIEMLLDQLGEKTSEGWILKVADDHRFAEEHPQTTLVHLQYWAKQIELFRPMLEKYRA